MEVSMNITVPFGTNYVGLGIYDGERIVDFQVSFFENSCGWGAVLNIGDNVNAYPVKYDGKFTENKLEYEKGKWLFAYVWRFVDSEEYYVQISIK